ncbi:MAG: Fur family transcriptional regulator [Minisyncoccota bacterium]
MYIQEEIVNIWRQNGMRLTKTRLAVADIFSWSTKPISVVEIVGFLKKKHILVDKTTVYRELERLCDLGIVIPVQLGERKRYFELTLRDHHHHLVCRQCEHVEDVVVDERDWCRREQEVGHAKGFVQVRHSLEFFGLCIGCQAKC